jgi:hypothetical protein
MSIALSDSQLHAVLAVKLTEHSPSVSLADALDATKSLIAPARERLKTGQIAKMGVRLSTSAGQATRIAELCNHAGGGCDCGEEH